MSGKPKYYSERIITEGKLSKGSKFAIVAPGVLALLRVVKRIISGESKEDITLTTLTIFVRIEGRQMPEDYFDEMPGIDYLMLAAEVSKAVHILKQKRAENYRQLLQKLQN